MEKFREKSKTDFVEKLRSFKESYKTNLRRSNFFFLKAFNCSCVVYFDQRMHATLSKTMKNNGKWWNKFLFHHVHERLTKKNEEKFVGQRLRVALKSWLTPKGWLHIWNFVVFVLFSTWATHVNDVNVLWKKLFSSFFFMSITWASRTHDNNGMLCHSLVTLEGE